MRRDRGLTGRAITFCVLSLLGMAGAVGSALIWHSYRDSLRTMIQHAAVHAASITRTAEAAVLLDDKKALERVVQAAATDGTVDEARVFDSGSRLLALFQRLPDRASEFALTTECRAGADTTLAGYLPGGLQPDAQFELGLGAEPDRDAVRVFHGAAQLLVVAPIWPQSDDLGSGLIEAEDASGHDRPVGFVALTCSLGHIRAELAQRVLSSLMVAAVMTAVAIGLTVVAARRLLRPVRNLVQTTAAIAQGNRATRASEHAAGEIGELARSFNHMADRLEESYASIERKVSDRTAELRARRRELENEITERRRTEEKLRESEERHRAITETAQDAIITADATGEIRFWNRAAEKIFGFTASEVLGKSMMDLIVPPQYHESKRKGLAAFARTGRGAALGKTLELTALRKDGTEFPIDISVSSYRDRDGLRAVALVRDITERKRIEEALQKEKNLLRSLVDVMEAMDVGVTIQDRDYTIVYQNRFMQNLAEGLGRKCYQVYEGCTRVCDGCPVKEAFRDGQPHTTERAVVTPEGEKVFAENTAHPIRDAAGQITSCFEVVRIVTDRKLAMERQQRLNDLQQRLLGPRELGDKLRMITDGVVSIFGADLCRIWMTRPGDRCDSGCMHADATEGPHVCRHRDRCLWLMASSGRYTHVDGEVHQRVPFGCYKIGRVAAGEEPKFLTNDVTTDPRVHNREWAKELGLVSFAGYQVRPPDKETIGVLALFAKHAISPDEDALLESLGSTVAQVVQKAMAEEALEAAHGRLVEASRQAGMAEVATGVLHNVGNVLNSVNVSASIVADKVRQSEVPSLAKAAQLLDEHADELATFLSEDERGKHLPRLLGALAESLTSEQAVVLKELQSLTDSVDHIKTIVSTQQSYAVASGLAESVSLASLVEDALRMNASSLQHRSIQVERDYAELPLIEVEKQKLLQILTNLIRNAGHALADQSGRDRRLMIQIAVSGDDRVRIEVADNGVGIPLENMTRIFAHGFTTKKEKGGRGFGLHHSALLAKEMGGSLTADSDGLGKGAIFTLELPLNLEEVAG